MKPSKDGITVQCIGCKAKRLIAFKDAANLSDIPMCETCFMPMVAVAAMSSVAIRRIVEEVKDEKSSPVGNYNRVYSRHNRGA